MKATLQVAAVVLLLLVLSLGATGELIRLTTGATANWMVLQPSPKVYRTLTYWGGVGVGLLYRSLTLSGQVTVTDFETLRITDNPAFYFTAAIPYFRAGSLDAFVEGGVIFDLSDPAWIALTAATGISWSPVPFTSVRVHCGYETVAQGPRYGSGIYIGINVSAYVPLL